ncbi:pentapeptide repeat-containing protein [Kroppenstedtia eburnea]
MEGMTISGGDWSLTRLVYQDLSGFQLGGIHFREADLYRCDFTGADLRRADLSYATLDGACLKGADLREAIMEGIPWKELNLEGTRIDMAQAVALAQSLGARVE